MSKLTETNQAGRARPQQEQVIRGLRAEIVRGILAPGGRVPPRRALAERFSVSLLTVQQALDRLASEGFVEARGRSGTFVSRRPPHLKNYALVFDLLPNHPSFSRLWTALVKEAQGVDSKDISITPWYGVKGHSDNEEFQRLRGHMRQHRVAGLIFPTTPHLYLHTPLLEEPGVPRVALSSAAREAFPTVVPVRFGPWMERALEYLASRGRRRVAVIQGTGHPPLDRGMVERLGLTIHPFMVQGVGYAQPQMARALAHLMVRRAQSDAPDGLVIADDNLLEYATAGIVDAGVRVPADLEVVAHCNFPWPTPSSLPVRRLGYDVRELLQDCLMSIDEQRQGLAAVERTVQVKFEDELTLGPASTMPGFSGVGGESAAFSGESSR